MIGVVLAGGASRRFGGQAKGLALIRGRAMALHVADILAQVCARVAIEAPRGAGYDALGLPLLHAPPEHNGKGPLAGIATGLMQAKPGSTVAFAPCDMPQLTGEVYRALIAAAHGHAGAYAVSPAGVEPLVCVLDAAMRPALLKVLASDALPRTHEALDQAGAVALPFDDAHAFSNVNTREDLLRLGLSG